MEELTDDIVRERLKRVDDFFMAGRIKRYIELGEGDLSGMPQVAIDYYLEAVYSFIFGNFRGTVFCAGAALELALKEKLSSKKKFKNLIDMAFKKGIFTENEKQVADKIRLDRNKFVHGDYKQIAQLAYEIGIRVQSQLVSISPGSGLQRIGKQITIEKPGTKTDNITYAHFGSEKIALYTITNSYKLLKKVYPTPIIKYRKK
jgi:hypothetical protein